MMATERQHRPIDKEFEECNYTGILDISGRNLRIFPHISDDIYDQLEVFTAVISGNRFDKFPKLILHYTNLASLNLYNNALRSIPTELTRLSHLRHLDLSKNFLSKLPSTICELKLERLSINNNRLQMLPHEIGKMTSLKYLDVSCNDLVDLPDSFIELQSLIQLNLRRNDIKELPTDIYKIPLWFLDVSSNSLTRLPVTLRHLSSLSEFHCSDNPLESPPAQICLRGLTHVFKYLTEMEKYGSDPQLFATNREESLMRRRRDKGKRNPRPSSTASTLSGDGSDNERSFLDEMSTIVQTAFGGKDGNFLGRNESEQSTRGGGSGGRHWTQLRNYDDNAYSSGVRYRSQSPGPVPGQTNSGQITPTHSTSSGSHFGTLPRSGKDSSSSLQTTSGGRGLADEPTGRSGSFHNYGGSKRVSSPVYGGGNISSSSSGTNTADNKVLRTLSSDNTPKKVPSNPDLRSNTTTEDRSYLSKRTDLMNHPTSSSTPNNQYYGSPLHSKPSPSTSIPPLSSSPRLTPDSVTTDADTSQPRPLSPDQDQPPPAVADLQSCDDHVTSTDNRSPSPANSRDGSITPTPDDLDSAEPLTPKKVPEELTVSNIIQLLENHDFNFSTNWDELGKELGVSLDVRQKVAADAHLSHDYSSAMAEVISKWMKTEQPSWNKLVTALQDCGQSSIANTLKKNYLLLDEGLPPDVNTTPQHRMQERQVSFSVDVSEIPNPNRLSVSSDIGEVTTIHHHSAELTRSESFPQTTVSSIDRRHEDECSQGSESPSPSPSQSPRRLGPPTTAPKPKKKEIKDLDSTWPKKRAGGPAHKRKGDVFKSIGKQDPNFTVRRMEVHMMEELEKIQDVKSEVEEILEVRLSDDLGEDISDGVLLCQLVNKLHPNTISVIHKPKQGETISGPKKTMNIAAFIAACKKVGVPETLVTSAGDISEYKDPIRVCACLRGLLDTVSV